MDRMTDEHQDSPVTTDVLFAEVRGFRLEQNARFDGIEREQGDMKAWLGRLSEALERQVQATTRLFSLEAIVANLANQTSDTKLDVAELGEKISTLEKAQAQSRLIGRGVAVLIGAALSALATGWADKVFK